MEDTALRRYEAVLNRQGEVFNGVPLENRGGWNRLFLSLAHGARGLGLLADATGASLRKMIVEFVVNESARTIETTTLERVIHNQFGLSVSNYAEEMAKDGAWGGFTEIAAVALKFGCIFEVYEKPDGNFKHLSGFGPEGPGVVRLAFTGRDNYRYLAAATEIVVGGQGRSPDPPAATASPDPPAANRTEDPSFDGRSLIGRPVLKWFSEVPAWFGGWVSAVHPPDPDLSDSRWLFTAKYEDDNCEDLELEELEAIIQLADPPRHVHLYKTSEWKNLRNITKTPGRATTLVTSTARIVLALESFFVSCTSAISHERAPRESLGNSNNGSHRQGRPRAPAGQKPNAASLHSDEAPQRGTVQRRLARGLPRA